MADCQTSEGSAMPTDDSPFLCAHQGKAADYDVFGDSAPAVPDISFMGLKRHLLFQGVSKTELFNAATKEELIEIAQAHSFSLEGIDRESEARDSAAAAADSPEEENSSVDRTKHLHDVEVNGLVFDAAFDSGNASRVEAFGENEFALWTRRDCEGTPHETGCRTWFSFSIRGAQPGRKLTFRIHNMNSQGNLYRFDMRPVFRSLPSKPEWERLAGPTTHWGGKGADKYREMRENRSYTPEGVEEFVIKFEHIVEEGGADDTLYFAFCYPWSYTETMARLAWLDQIHGLPVAPVRRLPSAHSPAPAEAGGPEAAALRAALVAAAPIGADVEVDDEAHAPSRAQNEIATAAVALAAQLAPEMASPSESPSEESKSVATDVYYHRELLTRSLDGRRVDLLTVSGTNGMLDKTDAPLDGLALSNLPSALSEGGERARSFGSKPVFLLTARVHPGESPASHVFEGALRFLLDSTDPRAKALRERFVFKLIPMINPDGVYRGHYRADTLGANLNRVYGAPEAHRHPAVFAIMRLVASLHEAGALQFYIDCHAHSNKRGCFLFGNSLVEPEAMADNVTYAKLVEANSRWFDFEGCVFSESNMYGADQRDGLSKAGSGRVATYKMTGLTHVYTLECNYNMGRRVNRLDHPHAPAGADQHRSLSPQPPLRCLSPKYTPECWQGVGKALAVSALDLMRLNPCSRLGAPGAEMEMGMGRLRSTVAAWVRTKAKAAKDKAAKKAAAGDEASDGGGSDAEGAGSDAEGSGRGSGAGRVKNGSKTLENVAPLNDDSAARGRPGGGVFKRPVPASSLRSAEVPFWAQVRGTPLTREAFSLRSAAGPRLEEGLAVQVLEARPMMDGTLRAAISLASGGGAVYGWMSLVMKDGVENATYIDPQPELGADGTPVLVGGAAAPAAALDPVARGEAAGGAFFVF